MLSSLADVSVEKVYEAFIEAFKDYEIKIDMNIEKFIEMLVNRSYNKEFSIGFFDKDILAGLLLIGYREIDEKKFFYDVGTGVRKEYRRSGIGKKLINKTKEIMKKNDIDAFLLEVLENNTSAIELYKNNGFQIQRKLNCYEINSVFEDKSSLHNEVVKEINIEKKCKDYCSFEPSWQNSYVSFKNQKDKYNFIKCEKNNRFMGYGIVHKFNGDILQIGIEPKCRNVKTLSNIINILVDRANSTNLKYLNVEDGSEMDSLLKKLGQKTIVSQYEMLYK